MLGKPQPEIPVWNMGQAFIKPTDIPEHVGADNYVGSSRRNGVIRAKCGDERLSRQWRRPTVNLQLRVHENTSSIGPLGIDGPDTDELTDQFFRAPKIVIVAKSDPLCRRFRHAAISCRTDALSDHVTRYLHARIGATRDDTGHIFRGGIVDDDDA